MTGEKSIFNYDASVFQDDEGQTLMKLLLLQIIFLISLNSYAEDSCDIRPGTSIGIKVIEFVSGKKVHSKIPLKESSANALLEEMTSLQDMGICESEIIRRDCRLKYEKHLGMNVVSMYRNGIKWNSWKLESKENAQLYVKSLKRAGFCK